MLQVGEPGQHRSSRREVHPAAQVYCALLPLRGQRVAAGGAFDADAGAAHAREVQLEDTLLEAGQSLSSMAGVTHVRKLGALLLKAISTSTIAETRFCRI